ncbi:uncharacterized protein TNCV_194411 [Trichonephila clavipes]|nr:uncharacterized protein TNCV_194411 [Trichonephila clavipes]
MPPNTLRVHTKYVLVKSVGLKVLWAESRVQETGEYFLPLQFHVKIVEVVMGGVTIYRPLGEFPPANLNSHLYGDDKSGEYADNARSGMCHTLKMIDSKKLVANISSMTGIDSLKCNSVIRCKKSWKKSSTDSTTHFLGIHNLKMVSSL